MSKDTNIEWCDSTVNPTMGCSGCELYTRGSGKSTCYAAELTNRYGGRKGWPEEFSKVAFFPERMKDAANWPDLTGYKRDAKPWLNMLPRSIFVSDMGDLFDPQVSNDFIFDHVWSPMMSPEGRRHFWILLTKRPSLMLEYERWQRKTKGIHNRPPHVMCMVSLTRGKTLQRLTELFKLPDETPRGVSIEPLLEPVNMFHAFVQCHRDPPVDWVIVGGESGPNARTMNEDWVRDIRDLVVDWNIPFFYKQRVDETGKVSVPELDGQRWTQMPKTGLGTLSC